MTFELDPAEHHGSATERLWAKPMGGGRFRLRNTPFYARNVSVEDVVLGRTDGASVTFVAPVVRGGHSTYRIRSHLAVSDEEFRRFWGPLEALGCSFEQGPVLAVDVPPGLDIYEVYGLLEAGEAAGAWDFEEGHCGHSTE